MFGLNKKPKKTTLPCLVIGEDRKLFHREMETTGVFFLDDDNRLAYDSLPESIGMCTQIMRDGTKKYRGQVSLLYEPMARPWSFKDLGWAQVDHNEEVILASGRSEGASRAVQRMEKEDRFDKMATILMLLSAGVIGMGLLFAVQSGIFTQLFGG